MDFTLKDLTDLAGITRDQANQWMKIGVFKPSRKKGTGRGSSKNFFTLIDCYEAIVFKKLTDSGNGWKRDIAVSMIKALDKKQFSMAIASFMWSAGSLFKFWMLGGLDSTIDYPSLLKKADIDPSNAKSFRNSLIVESMNKSGKLDYIVTIDEKEMRVNFDATLLLIFNRTDDRYSCQPIVYNDADTMIGSYSSIAGMMSDFKIADSAHVLNLGKLIHGVDHKLMVEYGEKLEVFYKKVPNLMSAIVGSGDKKELISINEILGKIVNTIG